MLLSVLPLYMLYGLQQSRLLCLQLLTMGYSQGIGRAFGGVFFQGTGRHQSTILWKLLSGLTAEMFSRFVQYFLPSLCGV